MKTYVYGIGAEYVVLVNHGIINHTFVCGFVEKQKRMDEYLDKPIINGRDLKEYDYIIVPRKNNTCVYDECVEQGIDLEKICFLYPCDKEINKGKNLKIAGEALSYFGHVFVCENYGVDSRYWIREDAEKYEQMNARDTFSINEEYNYYIDGDKFCGAGNLGSYFWQDLWAAKKIIKEKPNRHYDIGSRVDGFIAHLLAADIDISLIDVRPLDLKIDNLEFVCADATNLDNVENDSIESLSALCSLEHFGLGRYGDPIDPEACFKCFEAIQRKVKSGGNIYISVPIGQEHVEFNAHRIFYPKTIVDSFYKCEIVEFSSAYNNIFESNVNINAYDSDINRGGDRFGLFHFVKK